MKKTTFILSALAVLVALFAIIFVLSHESALLTHPKGIIAEHELHLMITNISLMLVIIVPTFIALFVVAWKYRAKNEKAKYDPEHDHGVRGELVLWLMPTLIVAVMSVITWNAAHELDPYKPIESDVKPLTIQVVAMDWKWLFIYPEQNIATVNFVQFPANTPIQFKLTADGSPMNSFWIPQLSGQIYAMSAMITQLHIMANEPGIYRGKAAEINGSGYASMTFKVKTTTPTDFDAWVKEVKQSSKPLTGKVYDTLLIKSENDPAAFYGNVEKELFNTVVMKHMHPHAKKL